MRVNSSSGHSLHILHCVSPAKMKWKVPLYVGIPPARRHGHTAFILHSHVCLPLNTFIHIVFFFFLMYHVLSNIFFLCQLFIFGGKNEEQEFNDLKVMKLINPSERQPGTLFIKSIKQNVH